jgi:hypothetical protein
LSDVLHDPGLGRAADVRLVLDVDRSVEKGYDTFFRTN